MPTVMASLTIMAYKINICPYTSSIPPLYLLI